MQLLPYVTESARTEVACVAPACPSCASSATGTPYLQGIEPRNRTWVSPVRAMHPLLPSQNSTIEVIGLPVFSIKSYGGSVWSAFPLAMADDVL
jgi:hypothetical protein